MRKTETLNLRVSTELKRKLVEEAKKDNRSVTNYVEAVLTEFWRYKYGTSGERRKGSGPTVRSSEK